MNSLARAVATVGGLVLLASAAVARDVRITGSDLLGAAPSRALAKHAEHSGIVVEQDFSGTRPALEKLEADEADVGLILLPPGEMPALDGWEARVIGYQPIVVLAPSDAGVTQVTFPQLRALFGPPGGGGEVTWSDLGGRTRARAIELRALAPSAGLTLPLFQRLLLGDAAVRAAVVSSASIGELEEAVRGGEQMLALSPAVPEADRGVRALAVATNASGAAFLPTPENLHNGNYALRLPLYLVFRRAAAQELLPFLRFVLSDELAEALRVGGHFQPLPVSARNQLVFDLEEMR